MKAVWRLCVVIFLVGISLLFVATVRINSAPRVVSFGNEEKGDTSGWVMFSDFLMFPREFRVDIRANNTVSVYILDEAATKQWSNSKTLDASWVYEDVVQDVFNEQSHSRGGYVVLVYLPEDSTTTFKVTLTFSGFEEDLLILSLGIIIAGLPVLVALLIAKLKNKNSKTQDTKTYLA